MTIWGLGKRGSHPLPRHFIGSGCDGNGSRRQKQKIASAQFLRFMFKSVYFQKRGLPFPFRGIKSATRSRVSLLKRPGHETARCPAPSKCPRSAPGAFLERPRGAARNAPHQRAFVSFSAKRGCQGDITRVWPSSYKCSHVRKPGYGGDRLQRSVAGIT